MSTPIPDIISKKIEKLPKEVMEGVTKIRQYAFYSTTSLKEIYFPKSLKCIEDSAFTTCPSVAKVTWDDEIDPHLLLGSYADYSEETSASGFLFQKSVWAKSFSLNTMVCVVNNRVLLTNTITDAAKGLIIPEDVVSLGAYSCARYSDDTYNNDTLTSIVVPDSVEIIGSNVFFGHSLLTKITLGTSVRHLSYKLIPNTTDTVLICRQPSGMDVELPEPGGESGLAYNKDSHNITIYTDNECIKNYNWSGDNVVATFYPLSQAPT